jgi:hypothetical protein
MLSTSQGASGSCRTHPTAVLRTPGAGTSDPLLREKLGHIWGRLEVLDQYFGRSVSVYPNLRNLYLRRFMWGKKDIVVSRVFAVGEFIRSQMAPKMIAAASRDMQGA